MKSNTLILSLAGVILLGLSGCARYQARPLRSLVNPCQPHEQSVTFASHAFNRSDCKKYLDRDVIREGYQPIHVTILNHSNSAFNLSLANFNMPCIDPLIVAEAVHTSTVARAASYGVGSLFLPILIIPAVVDGVGSSNANRKLDSDFSRKALDNQIIAPYSMANGLIFVPMEAYNPNINLTLFNIETNDALVLSNAKDCFKF